jgi:hypothetical protein
MPAQKDSCDVVIGGAGIAAAAVAIRLRELGFRPLLLATSSRTLPGIEAIPQPALCVFQELGITHILAEAGASLVEGFENHWRPNDPVLRAGHRLHVDRTRLAEAAVREALRRGAILKICHSLPSLAFSKDSVSLVHEGEQLSFHAAIDATGRSAVWSRPVRHQGRQVADIFASASNESGDGRGKVMRFPDYWAYRLGVDGRTTVAIIGTDRSRRNVLNATVRSALELESKYLYVGRRPAFPQWCEQPIHGRCVAIGDAVIAHDPISGVGIRFALSSALAAAAVLNTWKNQQSEAEGTQYYRQFIAQCLQRHLRFLRELAEDPVVREPEAPSIPEWLTFSSKTTQSQIQRGGRVLADEVVVLGDGTFVRWVGEIDLLDIRKLATKPVRSLELLRTLTGGQRRASQVTAVLDWCLRHEVLAECGLQLMQD